MVGHELHHVRLWQRADGAVGILVGVLVLMGLALLTWRQASIWQSDERIWRDGQTLRAHVNHRAALLKEGKWQEAIEECQWLLTTTIATPQQQKDIHSVCFGGSLSH